MLQSYSAKVITSKVMKKTWIKGRIKQLISELKYQNQNRATIMLQVAKGLMCRTIAQHYCRPQCWCCVLDMACEIIDYTPRKVKRNEWAPLEIEERCTPDLSCFRFSTWHEIKFEKDEYYLPNKVWTKAMLLGHSLNKEDLFLLNTPLMFEQW